jgi:hypothetical protein
VRSAAGEDEDETAGDDEGGVEATGGGAERLQQAHGPTWVELAQEGQERRGLARRAEQGAGDEAEGHATRQLGGEEEEESGVEDGGGHAAAEHGSPDEIDARGRRARRPPPRYLALPTQFWRLSSQREPEGEEGGSGDDQWPPRRQTGQRAERANDPAEECAGQSRPGDVERPQPKGLSLAPSTEEAQANGHVDRSGRVRA